MNEKGKELYDVLLNCYREDIEDFLDRELEDCEFDNDDYLENLLWNEVANLSESETTKYLDKYRELQKGTKGIDSLIEGAEKQVAELRNTNETKQHETVQTRNFGRE